MRPNQCVECTECPCIDVNYENYIIPDIDVDPDNISIALISESAPSDLKDYYYAKPDPHFQKTTVQAFNDAGSEVSSIREIVDLGVYLTTAVKCGKTGYGIKAGSIKNCSMILEKELALFPNIKVFLLMGDVAIKSLNYIAMRVGHEKVIPVGSTYKIRHNEYYYQDKRAFPSYLQAGPSFNIEKSKRRMIAEDITSALNLIL